MAEDYRGKKTAPFDGWRMVAVAFTVATFAPGIFGVVRAVAPDAALFSLAVAVQAVAVLAYLAGRGAWQRR